MMTDRPEPMSEPVAPRQQGSPLRTLLTLLGGRRQSTAGYPRQFWILFWGQLVNAAGRSMIWPFITIYMRQEFGIPLAQATLILTLNSAAGLATTAIAGPIIDRFGRKGAMVMSLAVTSLGLLGMSLASTLEVWTVVMILRGAFNPLYRVGSNAMVADLVAPDRRTEAYALMRMIANAGVAIGPAVGGFVTGVSYNLAFGIGTVAGLLYALLIALRVRETVPTQSAADQTRDGGGYGRMLRDWTFLSFCAVYTLIPAVVALMMVLLPVYTKENFGLPEHRYGFIMSTNAAMVVLFQYSITRITKQFSPTLVMAIGALFYGLGTGSVALGSGFWAFWTSMVVMTIGELMIMPTATTITAELAPPDMRGRYMGVFTLAWSAGFGIGPVVGGWLNDNVAPAAIWYAGLTMGLSAMIGFILLGRSVRRRRAVP